MYFGLCRCNIFLEATSMLEFVGAPCHMVHLLISASTVRVKLDLLPFVIPQMFRDEDDT